MGVRVETEKFDSYQDVDTLIVWYLDFTGDQRRWPQINDTFCLQEGRPQLVGRTVDDDDCRLVDPRISRRHALLEVTDSGLRLSDLGSANGTFVNGARISDPVDLCVGDQVIFDRIPFRVRRSLNMPDLVIGDLSPNESAGLARQRLINARRQRLASEGKLPSSDAEDQERLSPKLHSRYNGVKPIMVGSALALVVAFFILYFLA